MSRGRRRSRAGDFIRAGGAVGSGAAMRARSASHSGRRVEAFRRPGPRADREAGLAGAGDEQGGGAAALLVEVVVDPGLGIGAGIQAQHLPGVLPGRTFPRRGRRTSRSAHPAHGCWRTPRRGRSPGRARSPAPGAAGLPGHHPGRAGDRGIGSQKIMIPGGEAAGMAPLGAVAPRRPDGAVIAGQRPDQPGQDLVADPEQAARRPVVALRPEMGAAGGIEPNCT